MRGNAEGPRGAPGGTKTKTHSLARGWPWAGHPDQEGQRDPERSPQERAGGEARRRRPSGGPPFDPARLPLIRRLSVTPAQRQFIILQRGPAARCDPTA